MGTDLNRMGGFPSPPSHLFQNQMFTKQALVTGSPSASHREGKCQCEALVSCKHPGWSADYSRDLGERELSPSLGLQPGLLRWTRL